jgi:hypothetical protein
MRGKFVNGHIEVEGERFPDGTAVNFVVVPDDSAGTFELTPEQEDELEESIAEIERGEYVTADEVMAELRAMRERHGQ